MNCCGMQSPRVMKTSRSFVANVQSTVASRLPTIVVENGAALPTKSRFSEPWPVRTTVGGGRGGRVVGGGGGGVTWSLPQLASATVSAIPAAIERTCPCLPALLVIFFLLVAAAVLQAPCRKGGRRR